MLENLPSLYFENCRGREGAVGEEEEPVEDLEGKLFDLTSNLLKNLMVPKIFPPTFVQNLCSSALLPIS